MKCIPSPLLHAKSKSTSLCLPSKENSIWTPRIFPFIDKIMPQLPSNYFHKMNFWKVSNLLSISLLSLVLKISVIFKATISAADGRVSDFWPLGYQLSWQWCWASYFGSTPPRTKVYKWYPAYMDRPCIGLRKIIMSSPQEEDSHEGWVNSLLAIEQLYKNE